MSHTHLIRTSATDVAEAARGLGDNVNWSVLGKGRTAAHQIAECAIMTAGIMGILETGKEPEFDYAAFMEKVNALAEAPDVGLSALDVNTEALCKVVASMTAEQLATEIPTVWGPPGGTRSLKSFALLVQWNNTYHQGQIVFISTLL